MTAGRLSMKNHLKEVLKEHEKNNRCPFCSNSLNLLASVKNGVLDIKNAVLEFSGPTEWVPAVYFIPESEQTMIANGERDLSLETQIYRERALEKEKSGPDVQPAAIDWSYDRIVARGYANRYTSTVSSSPYYDTSKWNPNYSAYLGVDCANYVSQALYAGGFLQDDVWKPGTIAWINTGRNRNDGLKQYFVDTKPISIKPPNPQCLQAVLLVCLKTRMLCLL